MIHGVIILTSGAFSAVAADRLLLNEGSAPSTRDAPSKIVVRLRAIGAGTQVVRPVVFDSTGRLVVAGDVVSLVGPRADGWVEFPFARSAVMPVGRFYYGLHAGPTTSVLDAATTAFGGHTRRLLTDAYADGPGPGAITPTTGTTADSAYVMHAVTSYVEVKAGADDADLSQLPWQDAQRRLAQAGVVAGTGGRVTVGWHGTSFDPVLGAVGIVNRNGPLASRVGERVRVSFGGRSVAVYIHDSGDPVEDLSITRRGFMELAPPATDTLDALVEVLG